MWRNSAAVKLLTSVSLNKRKVDGSNPAGAIRFFFFKDLCYVFILPQFEYIHWKIEALKQ